jgi:hypothetical protein
MTEVQNSASTTGGNMPPPYGWDVPTVAPLPMAHRAARTALIGALAVYALETWYSASKAGNTPYGVLELIPFGIVVVAAGCLLVAMVGVRRLFLTWFAATPLVITGIVGAHHYLPELYAGIAADSAQYLSETRPDVVVAGLVWGAAACLTQPRQPAARATSRLRLGTLAVTAGTLLAAGALTLGWYATETIAANPGPPTYVSADCAGAQHASPGSIPVHFTPVAVLECGPGLHDTASGPIPSTRVMTQWRGTGNVAAVAAQFSAHRLGHQSPGEACTGNVPAFYLFVDTSGRAVITRAPSGVCGMYSGAARALTALTWTQLPSVPESPAPALHTSGK